MFVKVESNLLWYSRANAITSPLDSFLSADSDNGIFIIETSLGCLLKLAISVTNYYHIHFLRLLTEKKIDIKAEHRRQFAFKGERKHVVKINIPNIA